MHRRVIKPIFFLLCLLVITSNFLKAQVKFSLPANPVISAISKMEYFVDSDPGFGNGTSVQLTAGTGITLPSTTISLASNLTKGIHYLYFRSQDANGNWSFPSVQSINIFSFLATPSPNAGQSNITALEYFVDIDPGFGKATAIPITTGIDVSGSVAVSLTGLSKGVHRLFCRSQDANGKWSISSMQTILIFSFSGSFPTNANPTPITAMEYFTDVDPGFGNATSIPITTGIDITNSNIAVPLTGFSNGTHKLYARAKNTAGNWSLSNVISFYVAKLFGSLVSNPAPSNISAMEYFFDTDPGFGKGTQIPVAVGADVTASNVAIPMSGISKGIHRLFVRSKNTASSWSISNLITINVFSLIGALPPNSNLSNITAMEYFMDTDPGFGNGVPVAVTASTDVAATNIPVAITGLTPGTHKLYARTKSASGWSLSGFSQFFIVKPIGVLRQNGLPSNIVSMEYFFDTDPGFGKAITIPVAAGVDVAATNVAIPLLGLGKGLHKIIIRSQDANGNWSITNSQSLLIFSLLNFLPTNTAPSNLIAMECFMDTDPGFGNGTSIPIIAGTDVTVNNIAVPVKNLSNGIHRLFVRSKNATGVWSLSTSPQYFIAKLINNLAFNSALANITAVEYFFDVDPGFSKGVAIPISAGTDIVSANVTVSVANLPKGIHRLFIRSQDAVGRWSITNAQTLLVYNPIGNLPNNVSPKNISALEYFIDSDPGFGKGTAIPIITGGDLTANNVTISLSSLPKGVHRLFVRSQDALGNWSIISTQSINIFSFTGALPNNAVAAPITAMEYFTDINPGFGNGTAIPIAAGTDVSASNIAVPINTTLPIGIHRMFIRTKNATGNWSLSGLLTQYFVVKSVGNLPVNQLATNIVAMEYFFDTDPGFGSGTTIPITAANDVSGNVIIPIASLANGYHHLYIRSKDALGNWSVTNTQLLGIIKLMGALPSNNVAQTVTAMEYFVDSDPGYGAATPIPITSASDVAIANYAIGLGNLPTGFHKLFVRTKNNNGNWSIVNKQNFVVIGNIALPNNPTNNSITKLEYFVDVDPGFGNGTQVTIPATTDIANFNFAANFGSLADGKHNLYIRTYDTWSLTNVISFRIGYTALPVTWLSFSAKLIDKNAVSLDWQTQNEVNNNYFVVERSADGQQFDSIGMVTAKNVQSAINNYNLIDNKPLQGISYYRVKQVDKDGKSTYSVIVAIRISGLSNIHVSPNPFRDALTVQLSAAQQGEATLKLMDVNGKYLFTKSVGLMQGTNTLQVDGLGKLAAGSYILILNSKTEAATIKLIKE